MNKVLDYLKKELTLFVIGGIIYMIIEILWRGRTHWSMGILGGLCFVCMGLINELFTYEMYIETQALISSAIITILEFFTGLLVNVKLGWGVWDYSNLPFNIMGQICLLFVILWFFLSFAGIYVDDMFRYVIYDEEEPSYKSWALEKLKVLIKKLKWKINLKKFTTRGKKFK